mgnify:CR=1 FL=1
MSSALSSSLDGGALPFDFPVELLRSMPLFRDLSRSQLEEVAAVVRRKTLPAGGVLVQENEPGNTIFLILEGSVRIRTTRGDEDVILGFRGRGEMIGELSILDGGARSASVETQTPCVFACVSRHEFWEFLWPLAPVPYNVARILAARVRLLSEQVQAMATLSVSQRLARQILLLCSEHGTAAPNEPGVVIPFGISQQELAQMVGATRVQVNRTLQFWKRQNIVLITRRSLSVKDPARLKSYIGTAAQAPE